MLIIGVTLLMRPCRPACVGENAPAGSFLGFSSIGTVPVRSSAYQSAAQPARHVQVAGWIIHPVFSPREVTGLQAAAKPTLAATYAEVMLLLHRRSGIRA